MSVGVITLIIWVVLLILLLAGLPVAFCMVGVAAMGFLLFAKYAIYAFYPNIVHVLTNDVYIAIPLFVFMAVTLEFSGIATALYDVMYKWFGGVRGGLAIGTVLFCTIISAITGMGATGTLTMGLIAYPEMRKRGYDKKLAIGCIPAGGTLGPIIPPSVPMIIVGGLASLSVGKLFIGGIFPGVIISFLFICYIAIKCARNPSLGPPLPLEERASLREKFISLRGVILPIALIGLVLGTIYAGVATPTEAGGIGAFGAVICAIVYRKLNLANLKQALMTTLRIMTLVMWIILGGTLFSSLCGITGVSHLMSQLITGLPIGSLGILIAMMVIVFVMGMFVDSMAIILTTLPIFMPVIYELGYDPIWFALLYVINLVIGYITPPFGSNLFYFKGLNHREVSMADIYRSVGPYVPIMVGVLILCVIFPDILTWLPNRMIS